MENLSELINKAERLLPNWTWLVRSDATEGAFANLVAPDFQQFITVDENGLKNTSTGLRFPTYAKTPELALGQAIASALIVVGGTIQ